MYKKGLVPADEHTDSTGEHGGCHTLLGDGLLEQILASKDGTRVPTAYHLHSRKSGILQVYSYALWALQCPCNF